MGFFGGKKKPEKRSKSAQKKNDKIDKRDTRRHATGNGAGADALCTECGEWYSTRNRAAVDRHAH